MTNPSENKIIVAPLNWGWGHATRCIPVIKEIISIGYQPVIACDGSALEFLKKEFPKVEVLELPSYGIKYRKYFVLSMCLNLPRIISGILKEHSVLKKYIHQNKHKIVGVISDNRLGIYHSEIPSVYITHQLNIKAGIVSKLVNKTHHYFIKKHKECWVPDEENSLFSGDLSKNISNLKVRYVGVISRFTLKETPIKYDLLVLLSGIEGQRKVLENLLCEQLKSFKGKAIVVRGSLQPCTLVFPKGVKVVNYLVSSELEKVINASKKVVARSGYSTIMDLAVLEKEAFYIPTPGQTEQEYLAVYVKDKNLAAYCHQKDFNIAMLNKKHVEKPYVSASQHVIANYIMDVFKLSLA